MRNKELTEAQIEETCTDLLEKCDGWLGWKTTPVSNRARGAGFGQLGMADYTYFRFRYTVPETSPLWHGWRREDAEVMFIEWKRRGETLKPHQRAWRAQMAARGALVLAAGVDFEASVDGFLDWYNRSGLARHMLTLEARK